MSPGLPLFYTPTDVPQFFKIAFNLNGRSRQILW